MVITALALAGCDNSGVDNITGKLILKGKPTRNIKITSSNGQVVSTDENGCFVFNNLEQQGYSICVGQQENEPSVIWCERAGRCQIAEPGDDLLFEFENGIYYPCPGGAADGVWEHVR